MLQVFSYDKRNDSVAYSGIDGAKDLSWIRIIEPTIEKLTLVSKKTDIPLEELQECLEEEERPKIAIRDYLEIIYRAPCTVDNELETTPFYIYLMQGRLITIEKKPLHVIQDIADNLSKNKGKFLFKKGFAYFVFYIIDRINDDFLARIEKIAHRLDIYENFSKKELNEKDLEKIYDHSVTLSFFNQALLANVEVLNLLKKGYFKVIPKKDKVLFEELYYNILQIIDTEKIQREAISQLINVNSIITNNRLNEFIKRLTAIALIVAVPTLMSSLYGMNFEYLPLASHPQGFYIFLGVNIFIVSLLYIIFRRLKWT